MRIIISETPSKSFCLQLPTRLVLNRIGAQMLAREMAKHGIRVSPQNVHLFMKAVRHYKKEHPGWQLVQVNGAKGEQIEITL